MTGAIKTGAEPALEDADLGMPSISAAVSGVSVLIPCFNEERNIRAALESVAGISDDIVVLDSFSTDGTQSIVEESRKREGLEGVRWLQHRFEGYSAQWNWALSSVDWRNDWVLLLASDERVTPELKSYLRGVDLKRHEREGITALAVKRRFVWNGRWLRYGGLYNLWHPRLYRIGKVVFDARSVNEQAVIDGGTLNVPGADIVHDDQRGLDFWFEKHVGYARMEAEELLRAGSGAHDEMARFWGTQTERRRWIRTRVWNRMLPPLLRPFIYYVFRYVFQMGFRDGREGRQYHFLQGLWFPLLIDLNYIQLKARSERGIARGPRSDS